MSVKKPSYGLKDFSKDREDTYSKKSDDFSVDQKVRILQNNLVFVNALPCDVSSKELLQKDTYFGRYGEVAKLILNPPYPHKKGVSYQAYITYGSELDASLAIVALDGYKLSDRPLKVSFGTTKYCSHFLRGHECPNPDCFYLHKIQKKKQISSGDTRLIFRQQNTKAMNNVCDNLEEVIERIIDSDLQDEAGFPSLTQVLDYMIDNQFLTQKQVDQAYNDVRTRLSNNLVPPSLQLRGFSMTDPRDKERQTQNHKLVKSNSHSTMCTPAKDSSAAAEIQIHQRKKQQKIEVRSQQRQYLVEGIVRQNVALAAGKQNSLGARQLKVEQKIEKLIIKQILKKGNNQCRSRFIKDATASRQQCTRLRGIVQKYLIAHN